MITIVYANDDTPGPLQSAWGFSCLIDSPDGHILFDTGGDGDILLQNMHALEINPQTINSLVLSHNHWDHVGGMEAFLQQNPDITAYLPSAFPDSLRDFVAEKGGRVIETDSATPITDSIMTTPVAGDAIKEQGLMVAQNEEWVLITGCAHPGIAHMTGISKEAVDDNISTVLGGFHLKDDWKTSINHTTAELQGLGVQKVGPCHCSGAAARKIMKSVFGDGYIDIGPGTRIG